MMTTSSDQAAAVSESNQPVFRLVNLAATGPAVNSNRV